MLPIIKTVTSPPREAFPGLLLTRTCRCPLLPFIPFPCFSQHSCWCESVHTLFTYFVYFLFSFLSRGICLLSSSLSPASRKLLSKCWLRD